MKTVLFGMTPRVILKKCLVYNILMQTFSQYLREAETVHQKLRQIINPTERLVSSDRSSFTSSFNIEQQKVTGTEEYMPSGVDMKPKGMWYGIGTSWIDWAEENGMETGKYFYTIVIRPERVIVVTPENLGQFERKYGKMHSRFGFKFINWYDVAQQYDGVEFNPYGKFTSRAAMKSIWYSGVDVPSGCIWNSRAIQSFKPVSLDEV